MSKMMKFPIERCYNCGKKETLSQGIADLVKVEIELEKYSDDEEIFMPLCPECEKKWEKGELKEIDQKWKTEENKGQYSATIGQWKGDYGSAMKLQITEQNRESHDLVNKFCPFFKEICKGKECVMWNDEKCHIISYLKLEHDEFLESEDNIEHHQRGESEVPEYLKTRTAEEIALDLLEFWKKNDPNESRLYDLSGMFWEKKGIISTFDLSAEMRHKKNQALFFANRMFDKEEKEKIKEQIDKEKEEIPSLVSHCIDWSKSLGLKRLTHADIDAYLLEKNLVIRSETRRALYSIANVKLKSKQV